MAVQNAYGDVSPEQMAVLCNQPTTMREINERLFERTRNSPRTQFLREYGERQRRETLLDQAVRNVTKDLTPEWVLRKLEKFKTTISLDEINKRFWIFREIRAEFNRLQGAE